MKEIILIKNGELALKGLNRMTFEDILVKNIRRNIGHLGKFSVKKAQSTIYIEPLEEDYPFGEALEIMKQIFGIAAFTRALSVEKDMEVILNTAPDYLTERLKNAKTFKVEAKRSDKHFPLTSPEISRELGGKILSRFPHLKVDVHNPEVLVMVEIRDYAAYIHGAQIKGAGGMPVGSGGRAAVLISGGIDSPVAAYMMAKRGLELNAIHFASPPYTSPRAEQKVMKLLKIVSRYSGPIRVGVVPFTEIQEQIGEKCPEDYFTLIMRRFMMKISERLARERNCGALITGESVGQVASQTLMALGVTDAVVNMPVFRPVIGMDKDEIIAISRKIDAFETSIEPYEDCCTVFTPKHPKTRPHPDKVAEAEAALDMEALIDRAVEGTEFRVIDRNTEI